MPKFSQPVGGRTGMRTQVSQLPRRELPDGCMNADAFLETATLVPLLPVEYFPQKSHFRCERPRVSSIIEQ